MTEAEIAALGEDVPLLEGIRTTRAIRRLKPDPVPAALIRKVCEAGTFAPSGGNRQPWIFVALTDPEKKKWVAERYVPLFYKYLGKALDAEKDPSFSDAQRKILGSAKHLADHMADVPVMLFVAGWTRRSAPQIQALFPCVQNILLACRAVGLGASLTTLHVDFGKECDAMLGLTADTPSCAMLPIGWPEIPYKRPARRPVDEFLHWDKFTPRDEATRARRSKA